MKNIVYAILSYMILEKQSTKNTKARKPIKKTLERQTPPHEAQILAEKLVVPWAIAIGENEKIYFTERGGRVRVIENGVLREEPLIAFTPPFASYGEGGLLGIALDPNHTENGYLYVMYSYLDRGQLYNRVVRLVEEGDTATVDAILLDPMPGEGIHNGGRLKIGPDDKLYITSGDARGNTTAQDPTSLAGKILRLELDGSIPEDNPFPDSAVYSLGHRNPQGITWNEQGMLYASEHGQRAYDEINLIEPGENYGWPIVQGPDYKDNPIDAKLPLLSSEEETWAPSGMAFVSEGAWQGQLLVANLRGQQLLSITLDETGTQVESVEKWFEEEYGRLRDVVQGENGTIYLVTSNTDGRGNPDETDDKIIRITPL